MRAIVFANGELGKPFSFLYNRGPENIFIAADGGSLHFKELGLAPDVVIGDLDSLDPGQVAGLEAGGVRIIRYPARKDFTDLELALQFAASLAPEEILVFGALGNRWDQTLANLLLPAAFRSTHIPIHLIDGRQEMTLLYPGQTLEIRGQPGDTVSLVPLEGDASGIVTQGLEYPLHHETLHFGSTRGISNVLSGETGSVFLEAGLLLEVTIHQNEELIKE